MLVFFSGVATAWALFPESFDWRYQVVSSLASRRDNPLGSAYFCAGLAVMAAMLLPLPAYFRRCLPHHRRVTAAYISLSLGLAATALVGLERLLFFNFSDLVPKGHEYLALVAFTCTFVGVVGFWLCVFLDKGRNRFSHSQRISLFLVSGGPMLGAALSQAYLYFVPNSLGWVGPHWAALGVPLYLSFAFWEWLASFGVLAYLYLILLLLPQPAVTNKKKVRKVPRKAS